MNFHYCQMNLYKEKIVNESIVFWFWLCCETLFNETDYSSLKHIKHLTFISNYPIEKYSFWTFKISYLWIWFLLYFYVRFIIYDTGHNGNIKEVLVLFLWKKDGKNRQLPILCPGPAHKLSKHCCIHICCSLNLSQDKIKSVIGLICIVNRWRYFL